MSDKSAFLFIEKKEIANTTFRNNIRLLINLGKQINYLWNDKQRQIPSTKTLDFKVFNHQKVYKALISYTCTIYNKFEYQEDFLSIAIDTEKKSATLLRIDLISYKGSVQI